MIKTLLLQFIKTKGRNPNNLEMILLRQKAAKEGINERKIVSMIDRQPVNPNKPILGGRNIVETDEQMIQRFKNQNKEAVERLKNKKDPPEKLAGGGVAGLLGERTGFRGGGMDMGNASNQAQSASMGSTQSSTNQGPAGGASAGGNYGGNRNPQQTYGGGNNNTGGGGGGGPPSTNTGGGQNTTPTLNNIIEKIKQKQISKYLQNLEEEDLATGIGPLRGILKGGKSIFKNLEVVDPMKKGKIGVTYQDPTKDFSITQDIMDMIKDQKLDPKLKFQGGNNLKKGGNFFYEGTLDKNLNPEARVGIKMPFNFGKKIRKKSKNKFDTDRFSPDISKFNLGDMTGMKPQTTPNNMQLAKVFNTKKDLQGLGAAKESYFDTLTEGGEALDKFRKNATSMNNPTGTFQEYKGLGAQSQLDTLLGKGNKNATKNQEFIQNAIDQGFLADESDFKNQLPFGEIGGFADGGPARQNFAMGKRAFLKMLAGTGAGIAGLKTGLFGLGKKTAVKEAVKQTAGSGAPPAYFFKLVNKIKKLGDDVTETGALAERQNVKQYKDYTLTEDTATGRIEVQKIKPNAEGSDNFGNGLTEEVYMGYSPGETVVVKGKGIKTKPEYDEGTAYLRNDGPNTGDVYEEVSGVTDDIFKEVGEIVPEVIRKTKADGGRIGYAKGKGVMTLLDLVKNKFGKKSITTADKIKTPQKTLDRNMFKKSDNRLNDKRQMTDDEYQDFADEIGENIEAYDFDGTVGDAKRIIKEQKQYMDDMFLEYKAGRLDPVAGDKSPARKRFLEKKLEDAEMSGDRRLITQDEVEELSTFDLGTQMDQMKQVDVNKQIKQGVASIMKDTSPAALNKSIEIDNLMLKYPGMNKPLAEQIATEINPRKKADIIAMVEQTVKMSETGKSGDEIIQIFKDTTRRKQASGGLAAMLGE